MTDAEDLRARQDCYQARVHTLLSAGPSAEDLDELHRQTRAALGPANSVTLLAECSAEFVRAKTSPIEEGLERWERLLERVADLRPENSSTLTIRLYHSRQLRFRAAFGDLDRLVETRTELAERLRRDRSEMDWLGDDWIGVAEADLAVAFTDRARFGRYDPLISAYDPDHDLCLARKLAEAEYARRERQYTRDNPSTWHARRVLTATMVALALQNPGAGTESAAEAFALADELFRHYVRSREGGSVLLLRTGLLRAEALLALGRYERAAREARRLCAISRKRQDDLDPGRFHLVLAQALAGLGSPKARESAERALAERRRIYGELSHKVAEAGHFLAELR